MIGVAAAGGRSTRLGRDKTRLCLYGDAGPTLLERTLDLLSACTDEVVISCRADALLRPPGRDCRLVPDAVPDAGPLGAICSCLRVLGGPLLVLACDLPFMQEAVLRRLLRARKHRPPDRCMTVFRERETGRIEPLVAVYEPECLPLFEAALWSGERRLRRAVPGERRLHLDYGPEEAEFFFNINTPEDLHRAGLRPEQESRRSDVPPTWRTTS